MSTILHHTTRKPVLGPRPMRWTCAEFHRFGDLGMFEGRRAMLIDGVILEEGPMNPPHAIAVELVGEALRIVFGQGWRIRCQSPLVLGQDIDPEPDFAIVAGTARSSVGHPATAGLVIEVSDTSFDFDTTEKRLLYARAGLPEYWVIDINGRQVLQYRSPVAGDYTVQQTFALHESIRPLALPTATIRVAELFS